MVSRAGLLTSFAGAAEKVLPKLAGLRLAESTAERATGAAGGRRAAGRAAGEVFGAARDWPRDQDAAGRTCASVSVDATGVGTPGPGGSAADGRRADAGLIVSPGAGGRPARERARAGRFGLDESAAQRRRQGARVGTDRAAVWAALTDGGAVLEEFLGVYLPRAVCVPDFSQAAEHLNDLAKALYPGDAGTAAAWCHTLKHAGGAARPAAPEGLDLRGQKAAAREAYRPVVG